MKLVIGTSNVTKSAFFILSIIAWLSGDIKSIQVSWILSIWSEERTCGVFAKNISTRALGDTLFWGHFIDQKHTISSKMPQKQSIESNTNLTEFLCSEIFCAITEELQKGVINDNSSEYNETCGISAKNRLHSESMDPLTDTFKESFVYQESQSTPTSTTLLKKLNQPIHAAESMSATSAASSETVYHRKQSAYYEDQVHGTPIFESQERRSNFHLKVTEINATHPDDRGNEIIGLLQFKRGDDLSAITIPSTVECGELILFFYLNCTFAFQFPYQVIYILSWYADNSTVFGQIWFVKEFSDWLCV